MTYKEVEIQVIKEAIETVKADERLNMRLTANIQLSGALEGKSSNQKIETLTSMLADLGESTPRKCEECENELRLLDQKMSYLLKENDTVEDELDKALKAYGMAKGSAMKAKVRSRIIIGVLTVIIILGMVVYL